MQVAAWRIWGLLVWRLVRGPALVTFCNEFRVFYPLNFRQY